MYVEIRNICLYKIWIVTPRGTERVGSGSYASDLYPGVHSSNLDQDTGYSEWGFRGFPHSLRADPLNQAANTSFHVLSNSLFVIHTIIRRYIIWATDSVVE
jgi:hypothetical protein